MGGFYLQNSIQMMLTFTSSTATFQKLSFFSSAHIFKRLLLQNRIKESIGCRVGHPQVCWKHSCTHGLVLLPNMWDVTSASLVEGSPEIMENGIGLLLLICLLVFVLLHQAVFRAFSFLCVQRSFLEMTSLGTIKGIRHSNLSALHCSDWRNWVFFRKTHGMVRLNRA